MMIQTNQICHYYNSAIYTNEIDMFISQTNTTVRWTREQVSERASEQMSAAERASEASSAEQANE